MYFDDRLATVLRQRPASEVIARIQYRQLVDLLGSLPVDAEGPVARAAYDRLWSLGPQIAVRDRVQVLSEPGLRLRSPRLVAMLAQGEPAVASAAITAARLSEDEWVDLVPALPVGVRGILRHRRDLGERVELRLAQLGVAGRGLPPAGEAAVQPDDAGKVRPQASPPAAEEPPEIGEIGAIVRRIEEFRKAREPLPSVFPEPVSPRLPFDDHPEGPGIDQAGSFDFATDAEGRIAWADSRIAPMIAGVRLGLNAPDSMITGTDRLATTIHRRQPIAGERVSIDGAPAVCGAWRIDAVPRFDAWSGRFTGYAGRARRIDEGSAARTRETAQADRMREILHELRTPVGAIQMSAEVIQQQLYGPTPHEYRALAASIASDTARVLAGFDEMERLAKLETGALDLEPGETDLVAVLAATVERLKAHTDPRKAGFALSVPDQPLPVGLDRAELERLAWRLLAGLAGAAAPAEVLSLLCEATAENVEVAITLPAALADMEEEDLFHARADERRQALSAGMFGLGFTLRLARAEARAAGGALSSTDGMVILTLPGCASSSVNLMNS